MKIALIVEHFDAMRGGAEHLAVWLANQLAARGHDVHVVCHDVSTRINRYRQATLRASHDADASYLAHPPPEAAHPGIHIHRLRGMRLNTGLGLRRFGTRARQWCAGHQPDVAHSLSVAFPGDIYHACTGVYAALQVQLHRSGKTQQAAAWKRMLAGLTGRERTLLALERRAVQAPASSAGGGRGSPLRARKAPKRIISQSEMMTRQFLEYGVDPGIIIELPSPRMPLNGRDGNPADGPGFPPERARQERAWFRGHYRLESHDRVALFVGHDFRRKGLRYAIEAIARAGSEWKLLVVGLGKAREYVELAEQLGIGDAIDSDGNGRRARVLFVGPTREMERVYAAADAVLLPTFYDPFGLVVLEAFHHGLPVISTEYLGASALVRQFAAGSIVPTPQSVKQLAEALDALPAPGTPEYQQLSERARQAGAGISPQRYMESLLAIYEAVRLEKVREH